MPQPSLPPILEERIRKIHTWVEEHKYLLVSKKTKLIFNISNEIVKGEVTVYPDSN